MFTKVYVFDDETGCFVETEVEDGEGLNDSRIVIYPIVDEAGQNVGKMIFAIPYEAIESDDS